MHESGPGGVPGDPRLLEPASLRGLTLRNRIWLAPLCQYAVTAGDGVPRHWHLMHLGARAAGGFGLIVTEAAAVSADGRTTPFDVGLWDEAQERAWEPIVRFCREQGAAFAVQLSHAGRKASIWPSLPRYARHQGTIPELSGGWRAVGPTDAPFPGLDAPEVLDAAGIARVVEEFASSAERAVRIGVDALELHFAHGYLVHQFLSPLINTRTDAYGGDRDGRFRLALEIADAVRARIPETMPLIARLSATDWIGGGWDLEQSIDLGRRLRERGVDALHVSSGGAVIADITARSGYQIGFATEIREATGLPTAAVGLISDPHEAERIIAGGAADFVAIGRASLREPGWPQRAAAALGADVGALLPPAYVPGAW